MTGGDYLVRRIAELEMVVATMMDRHAAEVARLTARAEAAEKKLEEMAPKPE